MTKTKKKKVFDIPIKVMVTAEMEGRIRPLLGKQSLSKWVRECIRYRLDNDPKVTGSARHYNRRFREDLDRHHERVIWHLITLTLLVARIGSVLIRNTIELSQEQDKKFQLKTLIEEAQLRTVDTGWILANSLNDTADLAALTEAQSRAELD